MVPDVGVVPPTTVYSIVLLDPILSTVQLTGVAPYNVPVPEVAVILSPIDNPAVDDIPEMLADQGPSVGFILVMPPTMPVELTTVGGGRLLYIELKIPCMVNALFTSTVNVAGIDTTVIVMLAFT